MQNITSSIFIIHYYDHFHYYYQYKGRKRGDDFHGDNVGTFDPFGKIGEPTGGQNSRSKRNFAEPVEIYDPFGKGTFNLIGLEYYLILI